VLILIGRSAIAGRTKVLRSRSAMAGASVRTASGPMGHAGVLSDVRSARFACRADHVRSDHASAAGISHVQAADAVALPLLRDQ
jgi:hypothetical protein